jgi:hypothetical protein
LKNVNAVRVAGIYGAANPILRIYKNEISYTYSRKGDGNGLILDWRDPGEGPEHGPATQSRNVWVYQNKCYKNQAADVPHAAGISIFQSKNNRIFYNLCHENNVGIKFGGNSADDNIAFNNSCIDNRFSSLRLHAGYGDGKGNDLRIINNIFSGGHYGVWIHSSVKKPPLFERNYIFGTKQHLVTGMKLTSDSIFLAPKLSEDFELPPGSPLIKAGRPVEDSLSDFRGRPVKTPPSIGAMEFSN